MRRLLYLIAVSLPLGGPGWGAAPPSSPLVPVDELGLRVAPGFRVTLHADHDLAPDVYAMTLDSRGRVVVTSQGYIKTLVDTNSDGRADTAITFATPASGGMGMCFDGNDLLFYSGGALVRYRDKNGDGVADGPPEKIASLKAGEHGAHAIRQGPDGWWYLIGGNSTEFGPQHITSTNSPIRAPEAGSVMRFSPDLKQSEVIATGFRNPYDFDFNADGELFTYDSDVEREFFLPWYTPTRLYHVAYAAHHGWRLGGWMRSWARPGHFLDSVDWLEPVGRGSPTGVLVYRHTQFPERYRGGLFYLDWTFGKVWFTPLTRQGATYQAKPELFLEPIGTQGFAPTDVEVAPDGSLFISIGGRKTRGAVYRVEHAGQPTPAKLGAPAKTASRPDFTRTPAPALAANQLTFVLNAPQPLAAWSRARWEPIARQLGEQAFGEALANESLSDAQRIRAVKILVELFGGLPPAAERAGLSTASPRVRARAAWAVGRATNPLIGFPLLSLMRDNDPLARRCALETLAHHLASVKADLVEAFLPENLGHPDKRVRQAAARLLARMPEKQWNSLWGERANYGGDAALSIALASIWRDPDAPVNVAAAETAIPVIEQNRDERIQLDAIRLIVRALGDWNVQQPAIETFTGYEWPRPLSGQAALLERIRQAVRPIFPGKDTRLNEEASRLLAMLQDDDPQVLTKVAARITPTSSPTEDFHYLIVLARLRSPLAGDLPAKVADALLNLDRKLEGQQQRSKQTWGERQAELARALIQRNPGVAPLLLKHPRLATAAHVNLVDALGPELRNQAASLFLAAAQRDKGLAWSGDLVRLLARLPEREYKPPFRRQWANRGLRDELLPPLARHPEERDRGILLEGLDSPQIPVTRAALNALSTLPRDPSPKNLVPILRLLQRLQSDPKQAALRKEAMELVVRQSGRNLVAEEKATDAAGLKQAYQPVFDWFAQQHGELAKALAPEGDLDPAELAKTLKAVPWAKGVAARGEKLFRERACQTCHAAANALGPDLNGVTSRFSVEDLFSAIALPSRDVAPQFRATEFVTRDDQTYTGLVVFTSADGVIVQTGATSTIRLAASDIVSQRPSNFSLMPNGLLAGLKPEDLADLHAYLKSLGAPSK